MGWFFCLFNLGFSFFVGVLVGEGGQGRLVV